MTQYSRSMGVAIRKAVVDSYSAGDGVGFETAQRALWEIGDTIADRHGRRKAAEAVYRIADEIVAGDHLDALALDTPKDATPTKQSSRVKEWMAANIWTVAYLAALIGYVIGKAA